MVGATLMVILVRGLVCVRSLSLFQSLSQHVFGGKYPKLGIENL